MTYRRLPLTIAATLRKAGLTVVEVDGWKTRGRPASTGNLNPKGVLCHHTATGPSASNSSVVKLLVNGRSDLPGPLSQFGLARNGTVYLIASGRANHAGKAKASGNMPSGDGNELYWGIEAFNDGRGERWSDQQLHAYRLLCAVLCIHDTKNTAQSVRGHKETSVTGKIDPTFDMNLFRGKVAMAIKALTVTKPTVSTPGVPKPTPAAWNKFVQLEPKGYMDYWTAVTKGGAVDVDVQVSSQGTMWALLWNNVAKNGLYDPLKKIPGTAKISELTDVQIGRLQNLTGIKRAHKLVAVLDRANEHKTRVEVDFKVTIPLGKAKALMARPKTLAMHKAGRLQTKVQAQSNNPVERLQPLHLAGFITILSFGGYTGRGIRKVDAFPVTDYYRGTPKWL